GSVGLVAILPSRNTDEWCGTRDDATGAEIHISFASCEPRNPQYTFAPRRDHRFASGESRQRLDSRRTKTQALRKHFQNLLDGKSRFVIALVANCARRTRCPPSIRGHRPPLEFLWVIFVV